MTKFEFKEKTDKQLRYSYNSKNQRGLNDFKDFKEFSDWYKGESKYCAYCGIQERVFQEIVMTGKLTSKRFPLNGIIQRGRSRGVWLEIDRVNPNKNYSIDNVALCCYFCNNDKSDVFAGKDYKDFFQNRAKYLKNLLK
jgi:hypothetical protein